MRNIEELVRWGCCGDLIGQFPALSWYPFAPNNHRMVTECSRRRIARFRAHSLARSHPFNLGGLQSLELPVCMVFRRSLVRLALIAIFNVLVQKPVPMGNL
jgi:hypothetical protein